MNFFNQLSFRTLVRGYILQDGDNEEFILFGYTHEFENDLLYTHRQRTGGTGAELWLFSAGNVSEPLLDLCEFGPGNVVRQAA